MDLFGIWAQRFPYHGIFGVQAEASVCVCVHRCVDSLIKVKVN